MEVFMNQHPYLRAYMAGIVAPTVFLLIGLTVFCVARLVCNVPPIERVIAFPMAIVPNVFGLWNMLYVKLQSSWRTPIGLHGALLPFFLGPIAFVIQLSLGVVRATGNGLVYFDAVHVPYWFLGVGPFIAIAAYYLIWKYIVGYCNQVLGIAG